jgi:hypothetical protein
MSDRTWRKTPWGWVTSYKRHLIKVMLVSGGWQAWNHPARDPEAEIQLPGTFPTRDDAADLMEVAIELDAEVDRTPGKVPTYVIEFHETGERR